MQQVEFNKYYDKLRNYARAYSSRYFSDISLREDAVDTAMDKFIDAYIANPLISEIAAWAKVVISNSIKDSARTRKFEPIKLDRELKEAGMLGYEVI